MKKILILAAAAMSIVACQKESGPSPDNKQVNVVEVRIKTGSTYAAGTAEDGVGQENVITDGWVAFAKNAGDANYTAAIASGTGADAFATFTGIPVNSTVYVVANSTSLVDASGAPVIMPVGTAVTQAQIDGLIEAIDKQYLTDQNTALQADAAAPAVNPILMSGTGIVPATPFDPTPGQETKVRLTVGLDRELSKVALSVNEIPKTGSALELAGAAIDGIDEVSVRRVVKRVSPFVNFHSATTGDAANVENAEWFIKKTPYTMDDGTNTATSSDFRFSYGLTSVADVSSQTFYVTPNYAGLTAYATSAIIKARITGVVNGVTYANDTRYYRAYIYDQDIAAEKGQTLKNVIYKINASLTGVGSATEEEALDKDNVDLNVYVEVKKWAVRAFDVDME